MFSPIPEILEELRQGKLVIVMDDEDREDEGDLILAAEFATPEMVNFMAKHGRGIICMPMLPERLDQLNIELMVDENADHFRTAWGVSVDAREQVTTGISAHDRSKTIQTLIHPLTQQEDLVRPGHVFPLRARAGGVLVRAGHTEACIDLMKLAGLYPAGVICEIMNDDGTMARAPELESFAARHELKACTIRDLIEHRRRMEKLIQRVAVTQLPTEIAEFDMILYESLVDNSHHVALVHGDVADSQEPVLVRVHSECLTGDVFGSQRCDCGLQLRQAMRQVADVGRGVILYLRQHEGRGIGLVNKVKAYVLQDQGLDTVEANEALGFEPDLRTYGTGAQILVDLGLRKINLLTNNPRKIVGLGGYGLEVVDRVPIQMPVTDQNRRYIETKREKLGHDL